MNLTPRVGTGPSRTCYPPGGGRAVRSTTPAIRDPNRRRWSRVTGRCQENPARRKAKVSPASFRWVSEMYLRRHFLFVGLSFEKLYLINLMIPTFAKSSDFGKNHGFWEKTNPQISKTVDFRFQKLQISEIANFEKPRISDFRNRKFQKPQNSLWNERPLA